MSQTSVIISVQCVVFVKETVMDAIVVRTVTLIPNATMTVQVTRYDSAESVQAVREGRNGGGSESV